jgi:23S rRNA pseudouridine955/2504/2580 synthase
MEMKSFIVNDTITLEKFLQDKGFPFFIAKKMLKNKDVKINGKRMLANTTLLAGDNVVCYYENFDLKPHIEKVFEDDNVIIALKPANIESCGTDGLEGALDAIAVHRLDRNTQGLTVFAKTQNAKQLLDEAFKDGKVTKKYLCEVVGDTNFSGEIKHAYLFKDSKKSMVYVYKEKHPKTVEILTRFKTVKHGQSTSVVECELLTGKTHQIRAHLAFLGHAILGDGKYGNNKINQKYHEKYQKLFCFELAFGNILGKEMDNIRSKHFTKYPEWFNPEKLKG